MDMVISKKKSIVGEFVVPGDKSISHRAVMFSSIAEGVTEIDGFLSGDDCLSTIRCFRQLGVDIHIDEEKVIVHGKGIRGLHAPKERLDVGNSGTTIRLLSGLLSGQSFSCQMTGDASIQKRPMDRVVVPLSMMGADIQGENNKNFAPLVIKGSTLHAIEYTLPVASAQVKSAILLASLYAEGTTKIHEPEATRDHTEIMLNYLGADIKNTDGVITSAAIEQLYAKPIHVPGDISSAAFLIVAALVRPNSFITIKSVGVNKTRIGIVEALKQMGADIKIVNERTQCGEPVADIEVRTSELTGTTISGEMIPKMIDEVPIFAVAALFAKGTTVIKDAAELKVKESNRIRTMTCELKKMGADVHETDDGMVIHGGAPLHGATIDSHHDHRVAMSLSIAGLAADGETIINGAECVDISYPGFFDAIGNL